MDVLSEPAAHGGDDSDDDLGTPLDEEAWAATLTDLVGEAVAALLELRSPEPYLERVRERLGDEMVALFPIEDEKQGRLVAAAIGLEVWNDLPLGDLGIAPPRLAAPGRNDPCLCGSGQKLKRCCRQVPGALGLGGETLLYVLTRQLPLPELRRWVGQAAIAPEAVATFAAAHAERGEPERAVALCEPLILDRAHALPGSAAPVLDALLEAYIDLDTFAEALPWIERLADDTAAALAPTAREKLVTHLIEEGDLETAEDQLARLVAVAPDAPQTGALEVLLALAHDDEEAAARRAGELHAALSAAGHDPDEAPLPFLESVEEDPTWASLGLGAGMPPAWLEDLRMATSEGARGDAAVYVATPTPGGSFALEPPAALAEAEQHWRDFVLRDEDGDDDDDEDGDGQWTPPDLWSDEERVEAWLTLLVEDPAALGSLTILADLAYGLDQVACRTAAPQRLAVRLADRGRGILLAALDAAVPAGGELPRLDAADPVALAALALLETRLRALRDLGRDDEATAAAAELDQLGGDASGDAEPAP